MEAVYGINPLKVLLSRPDASLTKIMLADGRGGSSIREIISLARQRGIPVERRPRPFLDDLTGGADHQGIVGLREAVAYADPYRIIPNRNPHVVRDLVVVLDSIVDPQNLGAIIRSAHCLGANGVVIPADRAASVTPAVIKASAGSVEQLPIARVTNLSQTLDELKDKGFWVFGADAHEGKPLAGQDFDCPVALVLGSEAKGLRPLVKKKCDFLVTIPMAGNFDSFNVAVAAGIILYEIFRRPGRTASG